MRLFVSYSRDDAGFVDHLVAALEANGHDVWVDTEDVRGSESWRRSIATAISDADAVLLVISPTSMASSNVEREITLAAEKARHIVPVVAEEAELAVGMQFDLSGVQRISFADRSFDDAFAELLVSLSPAALDGRPTPRRVAPATAGIEPPATSRRKSTRRSVVWAMLVLIAIVAGSLAFGRLRDTDDDALATSVETTSQSTSVSEATTTAPVVTDQPLDVAVWFGGFEFHASSATFDAEQRLLTVEVDITSDQRATSEPAYLFFDGLTQLISNGRRFDVSCDGCPTLQPGASSLATLISYTDEDFTMSGSEIVFGAPDQHTATIPLDGQPGTSEFPTVRALEGSIDDPVAPTRFIVEQVEMLAAECHGLADGVTFAPTRSDQFAIVVTGTAENNASEGSTYFGHATLTGPDAQNIQSASLNGYVVGVDAGTVRRGLTICFDVPAPIAGDYQFVVTPMDVDSQPTPLTITF